MDKTTCDKITYYILLAAAVLMIGMFVALGGRPALVRPACGAAVAAGRISRRPRQQRHIYAAGRAYRPCRGSLCLPYRL